MDKEKITVSLPEAGLYYIKGYLQTSQWAWITFVLWGVGRLLSSASLLPALIISRVINNLSTGSFDTNTLYMLVALAITSIILGETFIRLWGHFVAHFQIAQADTILKDSYKNLIDKSLNFHANNFAGSLTTKINRLARSSIDFNDTLHEKIIDTLVALVFMIITVGVNYPASSLFGLAGIVVYTLIVSPLIRKRMKIVAKRSILESKRTGYFVDGITNAVAIKAYAKEDYELDRFAQEVGRAGKVTLKSWLYSNWRIDPITSLTYIIILFTPLIVIINQAKSGAEIGDMFFAYSIFGFLSSRVWDIANTWRNIENQLTAGAEGLSILNQPATIVDSKDAKALDVTNGQIKFSKVDFNYEGSQVFRDFNLTIQPSQSVGLVGPSGGGKSTFVKLILRFMDTDGGKIEIDQQDIMRVTQNSLRNQIGYIPQEPALFHRSIFENIAYGGDSPTRSEVIEAAKQAYAHEFIQTLPKGYDTLVGERGIKLSGGQRQRVAIARAFLKRSPILILDEATSALDSESEQYIQKALFELMQNRTTVVIAHRLSTIKHLDRIIVIDDGKIVQDGPHSSLSRQEGLYQNLWSHQSDGFI
ncbi:ABC transporter ATP-binding protein [Candidatus Saccharibacteria bacterium]|nr:ABC transporter ATP-binding protein [Candidatus Saccharibacteria bacterium]MCB9834916.1 ABC transporter ATP-binding protein [Candidatus Nomurabacteria bacterium]